MRGDVKMNEPIKKEYGHAPDSIDRAEAADMHEHYAEKYIDRAGDMIVREMAMHAANIKPAQFGHVGELCEAYNEMCKFWKKHVECEGEQDDIHDELMAAEKYLKKWIETGDATFQTLAREELRHASMLMGKAHGDTTKDKQYKLLYDQIIARVGA